MVRDLVRSAELNPGWRAAAVALVVCVGLAAPAGALASSSTAVSVGGDFACSLTSGGGVECWGNNEGGQLGNGTMTNSRTPVGVSGLGSGVVAISAGFHHACVLTVAGGVKCWGGNQYGELGNGTSSGPQKCIYGGEACSTTPVAVEGLSSGVDAVRSRGAGTCALTSAGAVVCWGINHFGQLGNGTNTGPQTCEAYGCSTTPVEVTGLSSGVSAISGTCAVTSLGAVKCWGANGAGQLGIGTSTGPEVCSSFYCSTTPVEVSGLSGVTAVGSGFPHVCALTEGGGVKCWGTNAGGALGNGIGSGGPEHCNEGICSTTPVNVSGLESGVAQIAVGEYHTCALASGGVKCWGPNLYGQVGDGTMTDKATPAAVGGLGAGVTAVGAGGSEACAVTAAGGVKCWGRNGSGQLGANSSGKCPGQNACSLVPLHANGFAAKCTSNVGKIGLTPGLGVKPFVQMLKVSGTLTGCAGEPFTTVNYKATLKTASPVSCSVLTGAGELAKGSAKLTWTPKAKGSVGPLSMSLTETPVSPLVGKTETGAYSPMPVSGSITETFTNAAKCGPTTVKKGTFTGSTFSFGE